MLPVFIFYIFRFFAARRCSGSLTPHLAGDATAPLYPGLRRIVIDRIFEKKFSDLLRCRKVRQNHRTRRACSPSKCCACRRNGRPLARLSSAPRRRAVARVRRHGERGNGNPYPLARLGVSLDRLAHGVRLARPILHQILTTNDICRQMISKSDMVRIEERAHRRRHRHLQAPTLEEAASRQQMIPRARYPRLR
jgi:hypothetical protein